MGRAMQKESEKNYKPKLAVMPFSNASNDEDSGYLVMEL